MSETIWSIVRLSVIGLLVAATWLLFGTKTAVIFAALYSIGGLIAVAREWNEYRHDERTEEDREGDAFTANYAVEVFTGWPLLSVMACFGGLA